MSKRNKKYLLIILFVLSFTFFVFILFYKNKYNNPVNELSDVSSYDISSIQDVSSYEVNSIPEYTGKYYIDVNDNKPTFNESDLTTISFEKYSPLDNLGRCGVAYANIGKDIMPTKERGSISMIKPSGWHTIKYDIVDGKYLYNRCHLIAYQLSAENTNKKNLITCTRQMNTKGMIELENKVADYVKETNNHVLYRVIPYFENDDLIARGVQIEALSVEDNGKGISFNVFVFNTQEGIKINYNNGESELIN